MNSVQVFMPGTLARDYEALQHGPDAGKAAAKEDPSLANAWAGLGDALDIRVGPDEKPSRQEAEGQALSRAARACVGVLRHYWPDRPVADAFGHVAEGDQPPAKEGGPPRGEGAREDPYPLCGEKLGPTRAEVLRQAEALVAMRAVPFVGQFFVHLRNIVTFLTAAAFLTLLATGSYPFQPQRLLILWGWSAVVAVLVLVVSFFVQADRDELLSRIARTHPNAVTMDWTFFSNILTYVIPLGLLLVAQIPIVGDWLGYLIAPLVNVLK